MPYDLPWTLVVSSSNLLRASDFYEWKTWCFHHRASCPSAAGEGLWKQHRRGSTTCHLISAFCLLLQRTFLGLSFLFRQGVRLTFLPTHPCLSFIITGQRLDFCALLETAQSGNVIDELYSTEFAEIWRSWTKLYLMRCFLDLARFYNS